MMKTLAVSQPEFSPENVENHKWFSKPDWVKVAAWSVGMLLNLLGWYIVLQELF